MKTRIAVLLALLASGAAVADTVVEVHAVDDKGTGASLGRITVSETKHGLVFTPALTGLT
ncbi:MAG: hypothetical protein K0S16_2085, partial [Moraxellaceae bacterium]|nr:hypothetical protein [Moraxellaceae bacterium]